MAVKHATRPRSKVSKACDNCRRRKIKCSGERPCAGCKTYNCECIFSVSAPTPRASKVKKNKIAGIVNHSPKNGSISPTTGNNPNSNNILTDDSISNNDSLLSPVSASSKNSKLNKNSISTHSKKNHSLIQLSNKIINSNSDIINQDISLLELPDITYVPDKPGSIYKDDHDLQLKLINYQKTLLLLLNNLKISNSNGSASKKQIINSILNMNNQIKDLINNYKPIIDPDKVKFYTNTINSNDLSIEYHYMRNKYTSKIFLNTITEWNDNNKTVSNDSFSKQSMNNGCASIINHSLCQDKLVDDIFGLYSPWMGISLRGIGYNVSKFVNDLKSKYKEDWGRVNSDKMIPLKESAYLLLRFFDICRDSMDHSMKSMSSPLELGLMKQKLLSNFNSTNNNHLNHSTSSSMESLTSLLQSNNNNDISNVILQSKVKESNKELLTNLVKCLPQPFTYNITSISNDFLLSFYDNELKMFSTVLKMIYQATKSFNTVLRRITVLNPNKQASTDENNKDIMGYIVSDNDINTIANLCQVEEILYSLCANYYNSTLYHLDDHFNTIEYLELLIVFLKQQLVASEFYGFERVLDVAINYAIQMGFSRWEFYVGLQEYQAEKRRQLWWKLYMIEKLHCMKRGFPSVINEDKINCLLPEKFRFLGYLDSNDYFNKINNPNFNNLSENLSKLSLSDLKDYGNLGLTIIFSKFSNNILFNNKYSSVKNSTKHSFLKFNLLNQLYSETDEILKKLDMVKLQLRPIFDFVDNYPNNNYDETYLKNYNNSNSNLDNDHCDADNLIQQLFYLVLHFQSLRAHIQNSAMQLSQRFLVPETKDFLNKKSGQYSNEIFDAWSSTLPKLLMVPDDYSVQRAIYFFNLIHIITLNTHSTRTIPLTIESLVQSLKVFKRIEKLTLFFKNCNNKIIINSKRHNDLSKFILIDAILTHMLCFDYICTNNLNRTELIQKISEYDSEMGTVTSYMLNPKSYIFTKLMKPVQETGFHINFKKWFEISNFEQSLLSTTPNGNLFPHFASQRSDSELLLYKSNTCPLSLSSNPSSASKSINSATIPKVDTRNKTNHKSPLSQEVTQDINNHSEMNSSSTVTSSTDSQMSRSVQPTPGSDISMKSLAPCLSKNNTTNSQPYDAQNVDFIQYNNSNTNADGNFSTNNNSNDKNLSKNELINPTNTTLTDNGYNIGTFDEFVNTGDLDSLLSMLLSDTSGK
ncbi:hypothetical protein TBLA_0C04050 [Henningerozyma blattae CBS 6284]|uniref:Zn(2)-C6 fungal-type domain-containing protein n=1 Tax=Henningerozyma blattae (strain ATCC 34711 / CBS 6284 / DSM 70876 / NBRC 10599 / NRRL Y-10934 / UCD 77-7) TaxID=1071380 RepID=I2H1F3_HENB6|nr:hypothetical protein TBLA_0C04050 [Tetrapisispora blattae CBS 6284]CCH60205.1 hypothetical protein TBLA_0C04050 [Tetrapisispora blattae CBS 6284]